MHPLTKTLRWLPGVTVAALFLAIETARAYFRLLSGAELAIEARRSGTASLLTRLAAGPVRLLEQRLGYSSVALRLPSLLLGGIALWLLWHTLRRLWGRRAAMAGALAWLLMPAAALADFATPGAGVLFGCAIVFALGCAAVRAKAWGRWAAAGVAAVACVGLAAEAPPRLLLLVLTCVLCSIALGYLATKCPRWPLGALLILLFMAVVARTISDLRIVRLQRHEFVRFSSSVERVAAPGENVFVADPLAAAVLRHYGSTALRQQVMPAGQRPPCLNERTKFIAEPNLPLDALTLSGTSEYVVLDTLSAQRIDGWQRCGYLILSLPEPDAIGTLQRGRSAMMQAGARVFLVAPASAGTATQSPAKRGMMKP